MPAEQAAQNKKSAKKTKVLHASKADTKALESRHADHSGLESVVVTAQRRSENSQNVPISIQHIDGKTLANAGYTALTDLQYLAPGVQYDPTQGAAFQIRGVGSESFDFSNAKSVSVVVDDVVMDAQRANGMIGMMDINNVDIMMGPQGTLFGMNSTSGVISVTTGKPELNKLTARGSASYGEHNERILNATVNVPLGDKAAFRLSAFDNAQDGFGRNVILNKLVGSTNEYGVRGKFYVEPTDNLDITLQGDYAHHWDSSVRTPVGGQTAAVTSELNSLGIYPNAKNADTADPMYGSIVSQEYGAALKIHAKLGENDLNFISAWRGSTYDNNTPVDLVPLDVYAYYPYNYGQLSTQKFSDEIRFSSPKGKFVEWLAGGFFNRLDARQTQYQWGTAGAPLYVDGQPAQTLYNNEGATGQSGNTSLFQSRNESLAAFGQLKFNISRHFDIAISGRYTHDKNSQGLSFINSNVQAITGYNPTLIPTHDAPVYSWGQVSGQNFSGRISPEYHFNPNVMAYFTFSTGYKPAGIAFVGNVYDPYHKETVKSYEVGMKSEWMHHKLRVNMDVFREDFTNFQATVLTPVPAGNGTTILTSAIGNAGGLVSQGVEGNVAYKPIPDLTLSGSVSFTDAHFTDYQPKPTVSYTNTRLTNAPVWSANAFIDYHHDLTPKLGMQAHLDYAYRGTVWTVTGQPEYSKVPAYSLVNLRVSLLPLNKRLQVGLYVRNMFNQYFSTGYQLYGTAGYLHYTSPDARRTIGGFINFSY
ncbi:TonB-dependent receptor [Acetobacter sp. TBRC 12305]|uniref:TonB-dependent receptor n=1 Tax=Acetobacter garciniae TaxID=2817435 RepID=A0A939KRC7_9PROT|nr:TonB-dependent receptor [Acetobacter garciniae]MBX0345038.1 TonB-dependent receptor [Acetobacter garciniae]